MSHSHHIPKKRFKKHFFANHGWVFVLLLPFQQISRERSQGLILSVYSLIDIYIYIHISISCPAFLPPRLRRSLLFLFLWGVWKVNNFSNPDARLHDWKSLEILLLGWCLALSRWKSAVTSEKWKERCWNSKDWSMTRLTENWTCGIFVGKHFSIGKGVAFSLIVLKDVFKKRI